MRLNVTVALFSIFAVMDTSNLRSSYIPTITQFKYTFSGNLMF